MPKIKREFVDYPLKNGLSMEEGGDKLHLTERLVFLPRKTWERGAEMSQKKSRLLGERKHQKQTETTKPHSLTLKFKDKDLLLLTEKKTMMEKAFTQKSWEQSQLLKNGKTQTIQNWAHTTQETSSKGKNDWDIPTDQKIAGGSNDGTLFQRST